MASAGGLVKPNAATRERHRLDASPRNLHKTAIGQRLGRWERCRVSPLDALLVDVRACRACAGALPLGLRPILQLSASARILIASQAPGTRAHATGIPFADASGHRLRAWMGVSEGQFYDVGIVAILPRGLCYPGRLSGGGDAPPRPECAPLWRERLLRALPAPRLTLLIGGYAQTHALGPGAMTDRVANFRNYAPRYFPLPHPSWRTRAWAEKHPWFETDVLPALRQAVARAAHA